jgi:PAS domain S-box-containing protein
MPSPASSDKQPLRVLVLDGCENDTRNLSETFQRYGYMPQLFCVETFDSFQRALRDEKWDVIISEIVLRDFDVHKALRCLKEQNPHHLDIPFIVVSNTAGEEEAVAAIKSGAHDYLRKEDLTRFGSVIRRELREVVERRERRHAEQMVELLYRAVESAANGVCIADCSLPDNPIIYINQAFTRITGYMPGDVLGRNCRFLQGADQDQPALDILRNAIASGESITVTLRNYRKDGTMFWNELNLSPVRNGYGQLTHYIGIQNDVTDRIQAAEIRTALDKERALLQQREQLIALISHEFRTPLTVINTSSDLLTRYYNRLEPERRTRAVENIRTQVQYIVRMLEDLIMLQKAQEGRLSFHPDYTDVRVLCEQIVQTVCNSENGIENGDEHSIETRYFGALSTVSVDNTLLQHILSNLLSNATKYSPRGSVIRLTVKREQNTLYIEISDQGIGIPATDQPQLFTPFFRASNAKTIQGTGLGLAIVKNSVEAHGGAISFVSEPNVGTTFTVTLPIGAR